MIICRTIQYITNVCPFFCTLGCTRFRMRLLRRWMCALCSVHSCVRCSQYRFQQKLGYVMQYSFLLYFIFCCNSHLPANADPNKKKWTQDDQMTPHQWTAKTSEIQREFAIIMRKRNLSIVGESMPFVTLGDTRSIHVDHQQREKEKRKKVQSGNCVSIGDSSTTLHLN